MADLVEIGIEVRTGKVTSATKEINALGESVKSAERSASIFVQTLERQEKQLVRASTHNKKFTDTAQRMYNNLLNVNKEIKSASASAQVFEKQILKDELAIQKNNAALAKMKGQYDLTFNAQQKLLQYKKLLRTAVDQEKMSVQEAAKEMKRYRAAMVEMGASQMAATKGANRLGVATQQAGYQVSDFIVQVQGGTNPFVAFSQQASQLAGILPLVADRIGITTGRAIALSSALGIAIPIIGLLGAAFLSSRGEAETFADALSDAESALDGLRSSLDNVADEELFSKFGDLSEEMRTLIGLTTEFSEKLATLDLSEAVNKLTADFSTQRSFFDQFFAILDPRQTGVAEFDVMKNLMDLGFNKGTAKGITGPLQDVREQFAVGDYESAIESVEEVIQKTLFSQSELTKEGLQFILNLQQAAETGAELQAQIDGSAAAIEKAKESQADLDEILKNGLDAYIERRRQSRLTILNLEQEVALAQKALDFGEDSIEYVRERAAQEAKALNLTTAATQKYLDLQIQLFNLDQGQAAQEAAEKRAAAIDKLTTKYTKLADAQMNGELGAKEATRRAREELELINAAKAAGIKLTSNEYLQLVKSLRTFQDVRKAKEDNLEITKLQDQALDAIAKGEFKLLENEIKLLRAKGDNLTADKLAVQLAGDRAYQAVLAKAKTEEEADALQDAAQHAKDLAVEAARVANATSDAKDEAKELEDALKEAAKAMDALVTVGDNIDKAFVKAQARVKALKEGIDAANAASIAGQEFDLKKAFEEAKEAATGPDGVIAATKEYNESVETLKKTSAALAEEKALEEAAKASKKAMADAEKAAEKLEKKIKDIKDAADPFREYNEELELLNKLLAKGRLEQEEYNHAVDQLNEGLGSSIKIIGDVEQAFSDWLSRGLDDFKGFVKSIKDMFIRLLADLAAQAVRNRILIPITTGVMASAGSAAAGTAMGQYAAGGAQAGTFAATLATGAKAFGTGFGSVFGAGGIGLGGSFQALGSLGSSIGSGTFMSTLGAAAPALIAVAAVVGLLTKKTKLLDSGLRATVKGFDVAIETFQLTQTSRLFGLLKGSKKTTFTAADAEVADPIISAINKMQESIVDAAGTLGIGAEAFEHFTYQFKVSLKGLSEEEQLQKVNEEITKMGDAFASLSGHFETMNDLLAVAQQRYELETRLLQLQGDATALLARQRQLEVSSTHELNQGILAQIHAIEDAQIAAQQAAVAVDVAFATVQRSIQARKDVITRAFNDLMENIQIKIDEANENVSVSRSVLGLLEGATSARIGMTREAGLEYLQGLRGASRITDQKKLDKALKAISDPSEDLYTNFTDYQRDFADQSNLVRDLENTAKNQLGTDEKTLLELQDQADAAETRHQEQLSKLDEQLNSAQQQINVMKGVDTSVKSVEAAIADLGVAIQAALSAQQAAKDAAAGVGAGAGTDKSMAGVIQANTAGQKILEQIGQSGVAIRASDQAKFQQVQIRGAEQLLEVANQLGVKTSGKTGAEIQQAISNAGNLGVNMDNATRAKEFALGGYFAGGLRMVGERGPELEMTGPSRIMSNNDTRKMLQNPDLVEAVKGMRQEIAELRNEQRQLGINNNKYTKRTYDLYRQWDTEGLPAERT